MLGFAVEAFGLAWWFDTTNIDDDIALRLRELWSRTAPSDAVPATDADAADSDPAAGDPAVPASEATGDDRLPFVISRIGALDSPPLDCAVVPEDAEAVPYAVSRAFTLAGVRRRTGSALMLHAVGVAGPSGDVVALVGKSGTGKTTAASHLARRMGYVTDETVVIDPDLRVRPYPKPLSIITDRERIYAKTEHSPDELDLLLPPSEVRLGAIVVLVRNPEERDPRLEAIGIVEAALAVLPETSALPKLENPLDVLAHALTRHGGPYRLTYAEIDECLDVIEQLADPDPARDASAPSWTHIPGDPDGVESVESARTVGLPDAEDETAPELTWSTLVYRASFSDAIASAGEVLLLRGHQPIALGGLSAHVWLAAERPATLGQLHAIAVESIGAHPRSEQLVIEAVQALLTESLLVIDDTPTDPLGPTP